MIYMPKGSMCMGCKDRLKDCSHLTFNTMPVITRGKNVVVVKCLAYAKDNSPIDKQK